MFDIDHRQRYRSADGVVHRFVLRFFLQVRIALRSNTDTPQLKLTARSDQSDDRQKVLEATDLVDLIGEHIALKAKGREYVALCPFHDDHNPSMSVVPHKQIFYCHPCGAGGNAIDFVMKYHGMTFREALELLASRAGIELTRRRPAHAASADSSKNSISNDEVLEANRIALEFFRQTLRSERAGSAARESIKARGMTTEMVEEFQIGASPDGWDGLCRYLQSKSLSPRPFLAAGLIKQRSEGNGSYDALRHRIVFPILDQIGRPVAFGARRIREDDEPKYLNSPETPVFQKSKVLFGLRQAFRTIQDERCVIVTEGYTDVIGCHQAGLRNVVATLGTALTPNHARVLRRVCDRVILLFDGDDAGQRAAERAFDVFFNEPIDVGIVVLPDGIDPDDLVKTPTGVDQFKMLVNAGEDSVQFVFRRIRERLDREGRSQGSAGRIRAVEELIARLAELGLQTQPLLRRQMVIRRVAQLAGVNESVITETLKQTRVRSRARSEAQNRPAKASTDDSASLALACLLCESSLASNFLAEARETIELASYGTGPMRRVAGIAAELLDVQAEISLRAMLAELEDVDSRAATTAIAEEVERITEGDRTRLEEFWRGCLHKARLARSIERDEEEQSEGTSPAGTRSLAERLKEERLLRQQFGENSLILPRSGSVSRE